jgi:hypothetical protein
MCRRRSGGHLGSPILSGRISGLIHRERIPRRCAESSLMDSPRNSRRRDLNSRRRLFLLLTLLRHRRRPGTLSSGQRSRLLNRCPELRALERWWRLERLGTLRRPKLLRPLLELVWREGYRRRHPRRKLSGRTER